MPLLVDRKATEYPPARNSTSDRRFSCILNMRMQSLVKRSIAEGIFSGATGDPLIGTLKAVFEGMSPAGYASAVSILRDADLGPRLSQVVSPTLVIAGLHDPLCPPAKREALAAALPHARFVSLDCGHFPPVEQPTAFARLLREHLTG